MDKKYEEAAWKREGKTSLSLKSSLRKIDTTIQVVVEKQN